MKTIVIKTDTYTYIYNYVCISFYDNTYSIKLNYWFSYYPSSVIVPSRPVWSSYYPMLLMLLNIEGSKHLVTPSENQT